MPFDTAYIQSAVGRRIGLSLPGFSYADVTVGNPAYAGSFFQIQEICTIRLNVINDVLIDVDLNYFMPNKFLGSWQIGANTGETDPTGDRIYRVTGTNDPNFQGRLTETEVKLFRVSSHVIGDPNNSWLLTQLENIDDCDFTLFGKTIIFGGMAISTDALLRRKNVLRGDIFNRPPPIEDKSFPPLLGAVGLYLVPGVELESASYTASAINIMQNSGTAYDDSPCLNDEVFDCDTLAQDYVAANPGFYLSEQLCVAGRSGVTCSITQFVKLSDRCDEVGLWTEGPPPP